MIETKDLENIIDLSKLTEALAEILNRLEVVESISREEDETKT